MIRIIITGGVAALAIVGVSAGIASTGSASASSSPAAAPTSTASPAPPAKPNCLLLGTRANETRHQAPALPTESLDAWARQHGTTGAAVCQFTNASKQITAFNRERFNQYFDDSTGDTGMPGETVMPSKLVFYTW